MGMMKRLYEELQELGYTQKQIENQEYLADGWTLEKLYKRYIKSVKDINLRYSNVKSK